MGCYNFINTEVMFEKAQLVNKISYSDFLYVWGKINLSVWETFGVPRSKKLRVVRGSGKPAGWVGSDWVGSGWVQKTCGYHGLRWVEMLVSYVELDQLDPRQPTITDKDRIILWKHYFVMNDFQLFVFFHVYLTHFISNVTLCFLWILR